MPSLVCVGLSHRTAPLSIREQLAVAGSRLHALLSQGAWRDVGRSLGFGELALLSTCNRTEVYAVPSDPTDGHALTPDNVNALLASVCPTPASLDETFVYRKSGADALKHLCLVASGLDSMVPGEAEVLSQVDEAREIAVAAGSAGPVLDAVFRTAVRAGRRARAETQIGHLPASIASEAIRWIRLRLGRPVAEARIVVVGTGHVARVAGEILRKAGARQLEIVGRSCDSTRELSLHLRATPLPWHALASGIAIADVVIATTAAPHAVIPLDLLVDVFRTRSANHRLLIADLAVPRDVDPDVASLPAVEVLDLDGLQERVEANLAERLLESPKVQAIIDEEVAHFGAWEANVRLRPLLTRLHQRAESMRASEVARWLSRMPNLDPAVGEAVESLSRALVGKLLSVPSRRLRAASDRKQSHAWSEALAALFELTPAPEHGDSAVRE